MKKCQLTDSELVSSYLSGNSKSFEILLKRHKSKVFTTIYLLVRDKSLAEDLFQDTFIKAYHTLQSGKYNEEGRFLPWISRMAYNLSIDYLRKNKRKPEIKMTDATLMLSTNKSFEEESEVSAIEKEEKDTLIKSLIHTLPDAQKETLMLRHYGKLSFQEIAETTGVSINTALGRMRYALLSLRKKINENPAFAYEQNYYKFKKKPNLQLQE